jgi:hypothetical protein
LVKYSLLGSILSNLLLVLGTSLFCGGLYNLRSEQKYDRVSYCTLSCTWLKFVVLNYWCFLDRPAGRPLHDLTETSGCEFPPAAVGVVVPLATDVVSVCRGLGGFDSRPNAPTVESQQHRYAYCIHCVPRLPNVDTPPIVWSPGGNYMSQI